jgi:hypothetical protein
MGGQNLTPRKYIQILIVNSDYVYHNLLQLTTLYLINILIGFSFIICLI